MIRFPTQHRWPPIGLDLGSRSVKLVQVDPRQEKDILTARWEFPLHAQFEPEQRTEQLTTAIRQLRRSGSFRGREVVLCLSAPTLFVQNVRLPKVSDDDLAERVLHETEARLPFPADEAEIRFLEAGEVRQGETLKREVIVLACHRPALDGLIALAEAAGLQPVAIDAEPLALLRCYSRQFRRDEDHTTRSMYVHLGASSTMLLIAHGSDPLFVKYVEVSGRQMDEAVARHLELDLAEATLLRRHNGDRRSEQQDPEVTQSVGDALRPVIDRLVHEISLCLRYHSVTFRGQRVARIVFSGGEATPSLLEALAERLDTRCELGEPLRAFSRTEGREVGGQWDVATGLALRTGSEAVAGRRWWS